MHLIHYQTHEKKQYFNCQNYSYPFILKKLLKEGKHILDVKQIDEINVTQELNNLSSIKFLENIKTFYLIEYNHYGILEKFYCTAPSLKLILSMIKKDLYNEILKVYKLTCLENTDINP